MKSIKGPAIFLAQLVADEAPFNRFDSICGWAASLGYKGVQIPAWDARLIDLELAAESATYCQELIGVAASHGVEITELVTHLQGQLVAVNPVFDDVLDADAEAAFFADAIDAGEEFLGGDGAVPGFARGEAIVAGGATLTWPSVMR